MKKTGQIFLCYALQDEAKVKELYGKLKHAGFDPWMDTVDLVGSERWAATIRKIIPQSDFFIACLSSNSANKRGFLQREISAALDVLQQHLQENIAIIHLRLEDWEVPESLSLFRWVDYFRVDGWDRLLKSIHRGMDRLGVIKPVRLRATPVILSEDRLQEILRKYDFCDRSKHREGKGIEHQYEFVDVEGEKVVLDHTTGLCWQQAGSRAPMNFAQAQKYILELNVEKFAGFEGWRFPTLEEAISLMEPNQNIENGLYIKPVFDKTQLWVWTEDEYAGTVVWIAYFYYGLCRTQDIHGVSYVRAVRSYNDWLRKKSSYFG